MEQNWSSLPSDILTTILDRLTTTTTNVRRLRGVCASWRISLASLKPVLTFPLKIHQPPLNPDSNPVSIKTCYLSQSAFYLIYPNKTPEQETKTRLPWVTRVEETTRGPPHYWTLQNPMSSFTRFEPMPKLSRVKFSFLDHNVTELARCYALFPGRLGDQGIKLNKIILYPQNQTVSEDGFSLLALFGTGEIGLWKSTTEKWITLPARDCRFSDALVYDNEFYVTDVKGKLMVINPSTFAIRDVIDSNVQTCDGLFTYLVESFGKLYLVNKEVNTRTGTRSIYCPNPETKRMVRTQVHCTVMQPMGLGVWVLMTDGGIGSRWDPTWSLDDRVFFVSDYVTFCVSALELGWNKGDCIFFNEDGFRGHAKYCYATIGKNCEHYDHTYKSEMQMFSRNCGIYNVPQGAICTTSSDPLPPPFKLFWPVPSWLVSNSF